MNNKIIILYSGGADSRLILEFARELGKDVHCVSIDYGQQMPELQVAEELLKKLNIKHTKIEVKNLALKSALTSGEKGLYENVSIWNVPNRNMMLLSFACALAENEAVPLVWYGADFSDRLGLYPDCYQEWVVKFNELLKITTSNKIEVQAPLLGLSKQSVLGMLSSRGISESEYFSGYGNL